MVYIIVEGGGKMKKILIERESQGEECIARHLECYILQETEKALLLECSGKAWVPKSILTPRKFPDYYKEEDKKEYSGVFLLPEWWEEKHLELFY